MNIGWLLSEYYIFLQGHLIKNYITIVMDLYFSMQILLLIWMGAHLLVILYSLYGLEQLHGVQNKQGTVALSTTKSELYLLELLSKRHYC